MPKKVRRIVREGFMDSVDFYHELGAASGGNSVYASVEDLKRCSPCVRECGISAVEVVFKSTVAPSNYDNLTPLDLEERLLTRYQRDLDRHKERVAYFEEQIELIKSGKIRNMTSDEEYEERKALAKKKKASEEKSPEA